MLRVVADTRTNAELTSSLDDIVREGARQMLAAALEAEVDAYVSSLVDEVDEHAKRLVVRNGHAEPPHIATGAGPVEVRAPRVNDRRVDEVTGQRRRFRSSIIPPWARKSPKVAEVLPLMYLHGMSSKDFAPALEEFFGSAAGLSASVITRLTTQWQEERDRFARRSLAGVDYVYVWVDGIHFNVRLDENRLCALVIVGVRTDVDQRRASRVDRVLGGRAARPAPAGHDRPHGGRRRRRPGVLGGVAGRVPRHRGGPLLGAQGGQRAQCPAQVRAARGPQSHR
jgi:transposase-like protein